MQRDRYIFDGDACYPISPCQKDPENISDGDQLIKILKRYPNLSSEDSSHLSTPECISYLEQLRACKKGESIRELFSYANSDLLDILEQMLEFNPYFRPTTKQLLKNKIFDSIRIKSNEECSDKSIVV